MIAFKPYPIEDLAVTPERRDEWDAMVRAARVVLESKTFVAALGNLKRLHELADPWCEQTGTKYRETKEALFDAARALPSHAMRERGEQPC